MTYLNENDPDYFNDLYKAAPAKMTRQNMEDAVNLFESDFTHMIEDIKDLAEKFEITDENVCGKHIFKFRRLNMLLSEAFGVAEELAAVTEKQNQKKAIK